MRYELISNVLPSQFQIHPFCLICENGTGPFNFSFASGCEVKLCHCRSRVLLSGSDVSTWKPPSTAPSTWALQVSASLRTGVNNPLDQQLTCIHLRHCGHLQGNSFYPRQWAPGKLHRRLSCTLPGYPTALSFGGPWGCPHWGVDLSPRGSLSWVPCLSLRNSGSFL